MCGCLCVYTRGQQWVHTQVHTHQSLTQKQLTLYPHEKWGGTVEGELPGPNGGCRDKVKNKVCLLCLPVELMLLGERGEVAATCCHDSGAAFIETRALLGLSQPEPIEESLLHHEPLSSMQGTA